MVMSWNAENIMAAHFRHTRTNYEMYLEKIHGMEEDGIILPGDAQGLARKCVNMDTDGNEYAGEIYLNNIRNDAH